MRKKSFLPLFLVLSMMVMLLHAREIRVTDEHNNSVVNASDLNRSTQEGAVENTVPLQEHTRFSDQSENNITGRGQGIYNYNYDVKNGDGFDGNRSNMNPFLYGHFKKIYRFDALTFGDDTSFDSDAQKTYDAIVKTIRKYTKKDDNDTGISNEVIVSILGFTRQVENKDEDKSLDSGYTDFFQSIGEYEAPDINTSKDEAKNYAQYVYEHLIDDNISKGILYKENRMGADGLYTEGTEAGREKNHRVEVAVYVKKLFDPDTDKDGVRDSKDYCPDTPLGARVDIHGCPQILTLHLQFSFDNDVIEEEKSYNDVIKLAKFMKKYPVYRATIIGHTDSIGKASYNLKLSQRRAALVVNLLTAEGVEASRLSSTGRGESEPIASNKTKEGRYENRRTEVELILPESKTKKSKRTLRKRGEN